ncbi:MAG: DUF4364 family protein [Eubacteriales bacterium]|nr:DUF4364 family protein [Eubacteriales bacterium]
MERAELATTKLIILYILRSLPAVTQHQLTSLSLDTLYMDYFGFASAYEGLRNDQMIAASVRKDEQSRDAAGRAVVRCDLTERGRTILEALEHKIPVPIRSYLVQESAGWRRDIRRERQLSATVDPDGNGQYRVRLRQMEGERAMVDLSLIIPDLSIAHQIMDRWQRLPQSMYLGLLALLSDEPVANKQVLVTGQDLDRYASFAPENNNHADLNAQNTPTIQTNQASSDQTDRLAGEQELF